MNLRDRLRRRSAWPAIGPALLAVLLAIRAAAGGAADAGMILGIAGAIAAIAVAVAVGVRAAPALLLIGPVALVASPSRTELSFNVARPGDTGWFVFTLLAAVAVGISLVGAIALVLGEGRLAGRPVALVVGGAAVVGVALSAGFVAALVTLDPQPDLGRDLDAAERAALPVVTMVNFGYAVDPADPLEVIDGRLRFELKNPSDLPHTFSVDSLDLDVYVPAGRSAVVDVAVPNDAALLDVYCAVGDHRALGMVTSVPV